MVVIEILIKHKRILNGYYCEFEQIYVGPRTIYYQAGWTTIWMMLMSDRWIKVLEDNGRGGWYINYEGHRETLPDTYKARVAMLDAAGTDHAFIAGVGEKHGDVWVRNNIGATNYCMHTSETPYFLIQIT